MRPRYLIYTVLVASLAAIFLAGCSVRTVPLEEEQIVYEDEYYRGYDRLPPSLLYDTWQLSQYRHYYGATAALGYPPPYRMNFDPNPHDSYRADEQPVQRAPAHTSIQSNRRVGERRDQTEFQQRVSRSRHARSNRLTADSTEDRSRLRKQLQRRHRQRRTDTADDEDRKTQRRTTRRRARR